MNGVTLALIGFAAMLGLIALRAPIGLSMLAVGTLGYVHLHERGWSAFFSYMKVNTYTNFANYTLSVIPLFILMGALAERAGIAATLFKSAEQAFGRFRGGLAMAVIGACTAFGAICGSSVATTATFGRAALPELQRFKYDPGFATGTIAVGGTLGILIPPSVILVVYAINTQQNIKLLFRAAVIPGLLAALFYCIVIALLVRRKPSLAPLSDRDVATAAPKRAWWLRLLGAVVIAGIGYEVFRGALEWDDGLVLSAMVALVAAVNLVVLPVILIAAIVVGGINFGVFSPTEGAAVGTLAMLAVGVGQRTLGWKDIVLALRQTAETSGMIFVILLGAEVFGAFLALSRLPTIAAEAIGSSGFSPHFILVAMLVFYIFLGAVMDELAMIVLTLPVFFPVIERLDFGLDPDLVPIWFGILVLIVVGIGLTAPPIGLNVFVISALARNVPISATYRGVLPFIAADIVRLALVITFPSVALWLVRALN